MSARVIRKLQLAALSPELVSVAVFGILHVLGQVVSAYAIAATLRMRSEERAVGRGRACTAVDRIRWAMSYLVLALVGSTIVPAALDASTGVIYSLALGDLAQHFSPLLGRGVSVLPAMWVMAELAAATYGLVPRFAVGVTWGALALFVALEFAWEGQQVS